jgi:hypothetical protein
MLLEYCQAKLRQADEGIQGAMRGLDDITQVQQELTNLKSMVPSENLSAEGIRRQAAIQSDDINLGDARAGGSLKVTIDGKEVDVVTTEGHAALEADRARLQAELDKITNGKTTFNGAVEQAAQHLEAIGQPEAAAAVRSAGAQAASGSKDDRDAFAKTMDAQASSIGASREMAMVRLQSLVSQRGTMLQMVTNMMNALNEAAKNIAANTGR